MTPDPDPKRHPAIAGLSFLAAAAAGWAAAAAHVPLAWILGPLIATAIAAVLGLPVFAPLAGRRIGQVAVGTSIGLNVTPDILVTIGFWLPVMVVTAVIAVILSAAVSVPFARFGRLDRKTAFFAMMPGGLSEMANLGHAAGARGEPIALSQALRVALLVIVLPPLIISLDIHGTATNGLDRDVLPWSGTLLTLGFGLAGVGLARLARINNPWMIGALAGAAFAASTELAPGRIPLPLYWFGQFLIGLSIGSRFKREIVVRLPRLFATSAAFVLVLAGILFAYAILLSRLTGLDLASTALGSSPGGLAEMAITAQTLHLSVGLVTAFHVVRAFIVNGFTTAFWNALNRVGFFDRLERRVGRG
ncbi:MAG: AbrB family transcriptional regulator [Microvirga sp.]